MQIINLVRSVLMAFCILVAAGTFVISDTSYAQKSAEERARERAGREPDKVRDNRDLPPERRVPGFKRSKPLSATDRQRLDDCVDRMLLGATKKKVRIRGHEFNCKRHSGWTKSGDFYKVEGRLSHHLTARPDDQVDYSFLVSSNGEIGGLTMKTKSGGFRKIVKAFDGFGKFDLKIGTWYADKFLQGIGQKVDGSWRGTSSLIIGTMAIRIGQSVRMAKAGRRGGSRHYWFVDRPGNDIRSVSLPKDKQRPEFCQNLCGNDRQCRAWTLNKSHSTGKAACWLKHSSAGNVVLSNRTVSGIKISGSRRGKGGSKIGAPQADSSGSNRRRSSGRNKRVPKGLGNLEDRHGGMEEEDP